MFSATILIVTPPNHPSFLKGLSQASQLLEQGADLYLYLLDQAVLALQDKSRYQQIEELTHRGLKLYVCAFALEKYKISLKDTRHANAFVTPSGLVALSQLIAYTDSFESFDYRPLEFSKSESQYDCQPQTTDPCDSNKKKIGILLASQKNEIIHETLRVAIGLNEVGHLQAELILLSDLNLKEKEDSATRRLFKTYRESGYSLDSIPLSKLKQKLLEKHLSPHQIIWL